MYCTKCGEKVERVTDICMGCGFKANEGINFCYSCGKTLVVKELKCQGCGAPYRKPASSNSSLNNKTTVDEQDMLANTAACFFPIAGIIIYFLWSDTKPKAAKGVCTWTIIGVVTPIVLYIFFVLFILFISI